MASTLRIVSSLATCSGGAFQRTGDVHASRASTARCGNNACGTASRARVGGTRLALSSRDVLASGDALQIRMRALQRCGNRSHTRSAVRAMQATWEAQFDETPYELLGASKEATMEELKAQYRKLVKQYHPDVVKDMDKDEAEHRFIALQSAYELLTDEERRAEYDKEHREHPLAANQAFQAYMARRKKAFDQRGDLAMVGWAEQQRLSNNEKKRYWEQKGDEEARRRGVQQQLNDSKKYDSITGKHMLVMKKRELKARKDAEANQKDLAMALLASEGFELEDEEAFLKPKVERLPQPRDVAATASDDKLLRG